MAAVAVDDQRDRQTLRDRGDLIRNLTQSHESDVRTAEPRIGDPGARHIARTEPRLLHQKPGQRVENTWCQNDLTGQ